MNEQNLSRDNSGRTQNINQPAESGGREEAWQGRTEDVSGQPSGYTAGDKRQDKDLTQRESDQDTSMGRDESLRGR